MTLGTITLRVKASLFISYSHKDQEWLDKVTDQLKSLENQDLIELWDDRDIRAGDSRGWEAQLLPKLQQAQIVLVLLSSGFAASPYCQQTELPLAIERKRSGKATVFFIHLRPYSVEEALREFQILPSPSKAILEASNVDAALRDVVDEIKKQLTAPKAVPKASAPSAMPSYLPYLCDRMDQEDELQLLCEARADRPNRPLVFLASGPQREAHHAFHDRLGRDFLPRLLAGNQTPVDSRPIDWPTSGSPGPTADKVFSMRVARALDATGPLLNEALPAGLTFLTVTIDTGDGNAVQQKWLAAFLAYWNQWPELPAGRTLCVGISLVWTQQGPSADELRQQYPEEQYPQLRWRVLTELAPPEQQHALNWLKHPKVKRHYDHERQTDRAREHIEKIFENQRAVAMKDLARRLQEALEHCA